MTNTPNQTQIESEAVVTPAAIQLFYSNTKRRLDAARDAIVLDYAIDLAPIIAERDKMRAALEWQLIESAPENGDEFLAADANQGFVKQLVYFSKINKCWLSKGQVIVNFKNQFTHWLAIPARAVLAKLAGLEQDAALKSKELT